MDVYKLLLFFAHFGLLAIGGDPMNPKMPTPESNGFVKTLNGQGYMTSTLDPYSRDFVEFVASAPAPALEIGSAYGVAALEAVQRTTTLWVNDLDARHLEILRERCPIHLRERLKLLPGAFPKGLSFQDDSLGAVLIARVLHFFAPEEVVESARTLFRWLKSGGKVFIVVESPYLRNFQTFIPEFEERKRQGDRWPGYVTDVKKYAPQRGASLPEKMLFFDPETLAQTFKETGFEIESVGFINRTEFPEDIRLDGRESVGLIGVKR